MYIISLVYIVWFDTSAQCTVHVKQTQPCWWLLIAPVFLEPPSVYCKKKNTIH